MEKTCSECRQPASRLRKGRCDACYMRQYRHGAPEPGDRCAACGERRRLSLDLTPLGVLCGNCSLVVARTRPRIGSVDELRARLGRKHGPERRGRLARPLPPPPQRPPTFDPSID
jgi:hypothetical protein